MRLLFTFSFLFLLSGALSAQPADTIYGFGYLLPVPQDTGASMPDTAAWAQLSNRQEYAVYKNEVEFHDVDAEEKNLRKGLGFIGALLSFFSKTTGKLILFLLITLLTAALIYRWLRQRGGSLFYRDKKFASDVELPAGPQDLSQDWEAAMQQAAQANDYRLAIRFGYLWLLQILDAQRQIDYHPNKTNRDYANEMGKSVGKDLFLKLSRIYERNWYGCQPGQAKDYQSFIHYFETLKRNAAA